MKKIAYILAASFFLFACKKVELANPVSKNLSSILLFLNDSLSVQDYKRVDFSSLQQTKLKDQSTLFCFNFTSADSTNEFIVLKVDAIGKISKGRILKINGTIDTSKGKTTYKGAIVIQNLHRQDLMNSRIINGYIQAYHTTKTNINLEGSNSFELNSACSDCTLPEVIVSSSYNNGGISWITWMNLMGLFDTSSSNQYMSIDYGGGGGGGGGDASLGNVITIDTETPENKPAVDSKKYIDCFGSIPDAGATYVITIATDIPVDGDPSKLFNWSDYTPGHCYIELYKAGSRGGIISQNIGFYPNTSWKSVGGGNITSKIVDDAGHEYNARYSITVSASQFQAALTAAQNNSNNDYNIATFNCTDFALGVFNAAGGNLSVPKYQIPGYPNRTTGSNTPQGLYNAISNLGAAGKKNIETNSNKAYGGTSHGPCN